MKIKTNRIYPYPVYSVLRDDYKDNGFIVEADLEYDSDNATVQLDIKISDEKIRDLIENDIIGLYVHIECSSTKYRELFEIGYEADKENYFITIPLYKLNDTVEIMSVLVAKEDISGFKDSNLNELYESENIFIPKYATLGYTDTTEIILTKRIDSNGDVPSIFQISLDEDSESVTYDLFRDQITVFLPKQQYEIYETYKGTGVRIKQMLLNVPVLIEAIELIKKDPSSVSSYPWYIVLEEAFKKKGYTDGFDDAKFINDDAFVLSQSILGEIAKDAFNEFDKMNMEK